MSHQPSPAMLPPANAKIFIGRIQEKRQFTAALQGLVTHQAGWQSPDDAADAISPADLPADQSYPKIFILHGIGGIGKTEMTRQCLSMAHDLAAKPEILTLYLDVSMTRPVIRHWTDLLARLGDHLRQAGHGDALQAYDRSERDEIEVRKAVERYKSRRREDWEIIQQMAAQQGRRQGHAPDSAAVSTKAAGLLLDQMQAEGHLAADECRLYLYPEASRAARFTTGLKQIARRQPLLIALDTLEVKEFTPLEPFLRDQLVVPTLEAPLIWMLSGRHNLDEDRQVEFEGRKQTYQGYREVVAENPPLAWDMKTFSEANIRAYLQSEAERRQTPLEPDDTLLATVKATTRGVPLALNLAADALFALPRDAFLREFVITDETLLPAAHVEKLIQRFLRYCLPRQDDVYRVQGMALLRQSAEAEALRRVWALPTEESVRAVLHRLRSQYTFMRGEALHDAVYSFVRHELRTTAALSEVRQQLGRLAHEYYHPIWRAEHRDIRRDPAERTREPRWQEAARHKLNSLLWYKPDEAMQFLRYSLIEGLGFDRRFARELLDQAQEFASRPNTLPLQNSHIDELRRLTAGLHAEPERDSFGEMLDLLWRLPGLEPLHRSILHLHQGHVWAARQVYERATEQYTQAENILPAEAEQLREQVGRAFEAVGDQLAWKRDGYRTIDSLPSPRAEKALQKALALGVENAGLYHTLGAVQAKLGKLEDSIQNFEQAIGLDPKDASPHHGLGNVYSDLGRYEEALAAYEQAIGLDPKYASPHNGLGNVYSDLGRYEEALAAYEQAIGLDPKYAYPHHGLGNVYRDLGRYEEALAAYEQAIGLDPKSASPHNGLGNVYSDLGRYEEALAAYEQAIGLDPKYASPHNGLGNVYRDLGRYEEALAAYEQAIGLDPKSASPHHGLGNVYSDLGRYEEALAAYEQAIGLDPK